jgi:hypothetical protein
VHGHRVSPSKKDTDRRGGALTVWDKTLVIDGTWKTRSLKPSEADIMAMPPEPFPVQEIKEAEAASGSGGSAPDPDLPSKLDGESLLLPEGPDDPEGDGESLLPEGEEDGESLLPDGDGDGESLLPEGEAKKEDEDGGEGESLLPTE